MGSEIEDFIQRDNARFLSEKKITPADLYQRAHLIAQWRQTESKQDYDALYSFALNELRDLLNAAGLVIEKLRHYHSLNCE